MVKKILKSQGKFKKEAWAHAITKHAIFFFISDSDVLLVLVNIDCIDCNVHFVADGSSSSAEWDERKTFGF